MSGLEKPDLAGGGVTRNTRPPMPDFDERRKRSGTRPYALHAVNPAGTKLLRQCFKVKFGRKPSNLQELREWGK